MVSITRPVVAIAGATGHLGKHVTTAFLSPSFQDKFSEIILLSRNESCLFQPSFSQPGATTSKQRAALPQTNIRVYFPSEFGVDHHGHDFAHLEWNEKKKHLVNAQRAVSHMNINICRVFCGLFLEDSIGPWFGLNTQNGKYTSVGSSRTPVSFTSLGDVGRTVASLATMPTEEIPDVVHVGGDSRSIAEIAGIMESAGAGRIDIDCLPYETYKKETTAEPSWRPAAYVWFLMGDGGIAHTPAFLGDDNELVNPGQRLWKWKTVEYLAKETNGQPVQDVVWPRHK
ncbi:hypothetical protein N7449_005256 [Penicillium cf. viridicatum]|uniref:NmrA-like domain-containing protein n=1 Tax=Penicillium cf. viridicatum TaxID=2972119 RepID=A0A9W9SYY8_9EURO|nr:hypothetical protein N7449_005256 [Penicillium cf. viridicatum]